MRVWAVLYNTGNEIVNLRFQEIRFETGPDIYYILERSELKFEFVQITNVPLAMLSSKDKQHIENLV